MRPDPDPHVHFIEELAELMLRWLLAVNAAARSRRLAGLQSSRRPFKHRKRKGARHA